jgi:hypothetical protein
MKIHPSFDNEPDHKYNHDLREVERGSALTHEDYGRSCRLKAGESSV